MRYFTRGDAYTAALLFSLTVWAAVILTIYHTTGRI